MAQVTRAVWKCDRCGHEWMSRKAGVPVRCGECKSPYWNLGPGKKSGQKKAEKIAEAKPEAVAQAQCDRCGGMKGQHQKWCGKKSRTKKIPGQNQGG